MRLLKSLERIEAENNDSANAIPRCYAVSSLFLHESFKKLTADPDEQFFFVTGPEVGEVLVLDQWAEFAHQRRSRLGVVADMPSTHNLLIKLEQFGHKFLAHFHSHPGRGAEATHPSGDDEGFQQRLEGAGQNRVILGGLVAGLIINTAEYPVNGVILQAKWAVAIKVIGKPEAMSGAR